MDVIDPGHFYALRTLDSAFDDHVEYLHFVKREGPGYPGNVGHMRGTTTQEVLRALIDRTKYVDNQIHDDNNDGVLLHLRKAIWLLEERAARRHDRPFPIMNLAELSTIEDLPVCVKCNHIGCEEECHD